MKSEQLSFRMSGHCIEIIPPGTLKGNLHHPGMIASFLLLRAECIDSSNDSETNFLHGMSHYVRI